MLKRIITATVSIAILIPVLIFSETYALPIMLSIMTLVSLYEMFSCLGFKNRHAVTLPAYLIGTALPLLAKIAGDAQKLLPTVCAVMMLYILYLMAIAVICHNTFSIHDLAACYMTSVYIICGFLSVQLLRDIVPISYLLVFIGAWVTDTFAYFTGVFFGKHKLCEAVSPKKTIEGSIGGTVFCAISFVVFELIMFGAGMPLWKYAILAGVGLVIAVVSQIGDLCMSLIKRHYGIKDFGKIFPGHGGMLDRFDSIIAVSTVLFIAISALQLFDINIFVG